MKPVIRLKGRGLKKILFAPILFLSLSLALTFTSCTSKTDVKDAGALRGGETRATLSPAQFTGATAQAYQIAKDIPEVLDSMYCYCDCEKHFAHKSLLTCYVDEHAAHCDICMDEAFMAYELHRQGMDIPAIRKAIDNRFSQLRH